MKKIKGNIWLIMLVGIVFLGIGYAAIANISLLVNGSATSKGLATNEDFKVRFVKLDSTDDRYVNDAQTNAAKVESINGIDSTKVSLDVTGDTTATFDITEGFDEVGDSVTLVYNVVNESEGIPAYIYVDVENESNSARDYFRITKTIADSELGEGEVTKVTVKVELIARPKLDTDASFTVSLVASAEKNDTISNATNAPIVYTTAASSNEIASLLTDSSISNVDITLTEDVTLPEERLQIPAGKSVTIDLNGKDINGSVSVQGDLVVEGDGEFTGTNLTNAFYVEDDATLTINGGNYTSNYNIGFVDGGSIVINGGTYTCQSVCFSGNANGQYKDFDMTVNGGTFTVDRGFVFYIPNPGTLTINGGTINGGILYRMATVNINGGVINASASTNDSDYDSYEGYYGYSGEPWFGDAITIVSGSYDIPAASSATDINPVLNITNGTIASNNGRGTALAILNLGKLEATPEINISGGTFSTNAQRSTFEILNTTDLNTTDAYKANNNFVNVSITGGNGLTGVTTSGKYFNTSTLNN